MKKSNYLSVLPAVVFLGCLIFTQKLFAQQGVISRVSGQVQVYSPTEDVWHEAGKNLTIREGQKIRTSGGRSRATVRLEDESHVEVGPDSSVSFEDLKKESPTIKVAIGRLKAWVSKFKRSKFEVHTPIAVCSVRGTEFEVAVDEKGNTTIDVLEGVVGVAKQDEIFKEMALGAGERLEVKENAPISPSDKSESPSSLNEKSIRQEVGLGMSKEAVQSAAAEEMRLSEYMEGKTLIDIFGKRVRLDEYIVRPAADTFKLVVLNERSDRFDYFYYKGQFNKDLPSDMSDALKYLGGKALEQPEYYLVSYETGRSNTLDTVKETASGGHLVDVNSNADTADDVSYYYDSASDSYLELSQGQAFYKPLFDKYEYFINSTKKMWYDATNLQSVNLAQWKYDGTIMESKTEWPMGENVLYQRISNYYGNGTWEMWDNYIISDEGKLATAASFGGITSGKSYKEELLKWNYQQVITASEFGGRKIDLVVEPKIFIKSGIIR